MNKTDRLLQMMEQPQRYTADQWQEILADEECRELYVLMSKTRSALDAARADEVVTDEMIDDEWQRLAQPNSSLFTLHSSLSKIAAIFVGILMLSGIAYAAFHMVSHKETPKEQRTKAPLTTHHSSLTRLMSPTPSLYPSLSSTTTYHWAKS